MAFAICAFAICHSPTAAHAVDHNNVDAGRPLSFDDAESIAFGEQAFEAGLGLGWPQRRPLGGGLDFEYLNGVALNTHVSLGISPSLGGRSDMRSTRFSPGDLTFGVLHNFRRETERSPAFSLAGELMAPTGRGSQGVAYRLRGIMSRHAGQYGRIHLNLDLNGGTGLSANQREFFPSATLGYTRPLGMPHTFTTTGVAELGVTPGPFRNRGPMLFAGIGIRKQISPRSVIDVGIQSDLVGWNDARRDRIRLVFGYSTGF